MLNQFYARRAAFRLMLRLALLPLAGLCTAAPSFAQAPVAPSAVPEIVVQGVGEVTVTPDMARLEFSVTTNNKDSALAVRENATRMDAVLKAIRGAGIADKDVRTVGFNLSPQYRYENNVPPVLLGYQVTNAVRVTVRRLADTGKVIDAATKAGANGSGAIELMLNEADAEKAAEEALAKAVADAARKARIMGRAANLQGLKVRSITEGTIRDDVPRPMFAGRAMANEVATPVQAGEQKITASVTVRYSYDAATAPTLP